MKRLLKVVAFVSGVCAFVPRTTALTYDFKTAATEGTVAGKFNDEHRQLVTLQLAAIGLLEDGFAFSKGQPGLMTWLWKCREPESLVPEKTAFVLDVPRGFAFVDASFADPKTLKRERRPNGDERVSFFGAAKFNGTAPTRRFDNWSEIGILLESTGDVGTEGELCFSVVQGGKPISNLQRIRLSTIPAVRAKSPRRCRFGIMPGGLYADFPTMAGDRAFAQLAADAGMSWIIPYRVNPEKIDLWHGLGMKVTPQFWHLYMNGFCVGRDGGRPESDRYRAIDPKRTPAAELNRAACPVSVYREHEFFRTNSMPELRDFLKGADGLWVNWEPYLFNGNGCICENCRREFARYTGIPEDEVAANWPREIDRENGKWREQIRRFRSWQFAGLVKTLDRYVRTFTGNERSEGLIPGVCWRDMYSRWRDDRRTDEYVVREYADTLKWMNPWGPYVFWRARTPAKWIDGETVCVTEGETVMNFLVAQDVRECVDREYPVGSRPKLMAMPHGLQQPDWLAQPEWIEVSLDAFTFSRWEALVPFTFPKGHDAIYWRRIANAADRAAKWEEYVWNGVRADTQTFVTPRAASARNIVSPSPYCKNLSMRNVPLLQMTAFDYMGNRLVAVFSFVDQGMTDFVLRAEGLNGRFELEAEEGPGGAVSAEELNRGVSLSIGPCRCRTFLLRSVK